MPVSDQIATQLFQEIFQQLKEIRETQLETVDRTARIEAVLIPSVGQPNLLQQHEERISSLESSKNWTLGAFAVLAAGWEYIIHRVLKS